MKTRFGRWATLAALCAGTVTAQAASVTLTGWAFGAGAVVQTNQYQGWAGGFGGRLAGSGIADTDSFVTYCIELEEHFSFSGSAMQDYTVVEGDAYFERRRGRAAIADKLGRLFTYVADHPGSVDSSFESTALQVAVWNLVYDTDDTVLSTTGFRYTDPTNRTGTYADMLLTGALGVTGSRFDVYALEKRGSQDFVLLAPRAPQRDASVPEPGTLALGAAALAGMGMVRRRRSVSQRPAV